MSKLGKVKMTEPPINNSATMARKYRQQPEHAHAKPSEQNVRCKVAFNQEGLNLKMDGPMFELHVIPKERIMLLVLGTSKITVWDQQTEGIQNASIYHLVFDDSLYAYDMMLLCLASDARSKNKNIRSGEVAQALVDKYTNPAADRGVRIDEISTDSDDAEAENNGDCAETQEDMEVRAADGLETSNRQNPDPEANPVTLNRIHTNNVGTNNQQTPRRSRPSATTSTNRRSTRLSSRLVVSPQTLED